ncbi:MAG: hypothetical protein ACYC4H_13175 [Desulfocucumaceae bacterium]
MIEHAKILEMAEVIGDIRLKLERLMDLGAGINCVGRNVERMSACLKMLELNISDTEEILRPGGADAS